MANERNPSLYQQTQAGFVAPGRSSELGALATGAGNLIEGGAKLYADSLANDLAEELDRDRERTLALLESPEAPQLEGQDAKTVDEFASYMNDLQTAHDNNSKSITDLKIRQEKRLREAMARYPKLAPHFQKAATGVLGYNPIGAELRAAEEEQRRASQDNRPAMLKKIMDMASTAGVNPMLYYSNRNEYWRQAQDALDTRSRIESQAAQLELMKSEIGTAGLIQTGALHEFMRNLSSTAWGDISSRMSDYYEAAGMTAGMSNAQIAERIQEATRSGLFTQMQQALVMERQNFIDEAYDSYYGQFGIDVETPGGAAHLAPIGRQEFEETLKPVLAQYDWAIQNVNKPAALEHIKTMNELDKQRVVGGIPFNIQQIAAYGDMFGADSSLGAVLAQSEIGERTAKLLHSTMMPFFGGATRPGQQPEPPVVDPNGQYNPSAVQSGAGMMPSPTDFGVMGYSNQDLESLNLTYEELLTGYVRPWMKTATETLQSDPQKAAISAGVTVRILQKYGNMVMGQREAGGTVPSRTTDMAYIEAMADENFATVVRIAGGRRVVSPKIMASMKGIMLTRASESYWELEQDIKSALMRPEVFFGTADQYGVAQDFDPGPNFVSGTLQDSIEVDIEEDGSIVFSGKNEQPVTQAFVDYLNSYDPGVMQELGLMTRAWAHADGSKNYSKAWRSLLGYN